MHRPSARVAVIILLVLAPTVLPGQVKVSYEPLDYAAFAAAVAPRLAQIATDFRAGHEKLKERSGAAGAPYPAEEVEALLRDCEGISDPGERQTASIRRI